MNSRHATVTRHFPTRQCIEEDERFLLGDEEEIGDIQDYSFVSGKYLQPALKRRIVEADISAGEESDEPEWSEELGVRRP